MTIEEFFGDRAFDVFQGHAFADTFVVAYAEPPRIYVSAGLIKYITTEVKAGGEIEFIRNLKISKAFKKTPL